jgi:NitT/TauT family transport system substrate-binding protein
MLRRPAKFRSRGRKYAECKSFWEARNPCGAWHGSCGIALCFAAQQTWPMGLAAMKKKHLFAAIAALALTVAPAGAADLMPINLGISKLGAMTNIWVASKLGIFKKHGLDVRIEEIPLTSQSISVLQSKSVDIVLQIPGTAMAAKEQGFDIVLVGQNETAGTTPPVSNALMVRANLSIASVKELAGKRIATASPRGQSYAALKEVFQRAGLSAGDVQILEAPFTAHADLLRSGQVDAVVALDPYTTQITNAAYGRPLSWFMIETIPDQPVGAWWALRSWAQQHPKEIAAFQDAIKESHAFLNADPAQAKKFVSEYSGLDPELVQAMPLISWKSSIEPKIWQEVIDMMQRQGELTSKHDVAEYLAR